MAIEMNDTVKKPYIWFVGNSIKDDGALGGFSQRVDDSKHLNPGSTSTISGITEFNQEDILTFDGSVRIIITNQVGGKHLYERESGLLPNNTFEGNDMFDTGANIDSINKDAETWYTLNGKEPIRTESQFYNFTDMNDRKAIGEKTDNLNSLGFVLRTNPTGSDLVTLKAKTYYLGQESKISIITFKIALSTTNLEFYQTPK
jgi:hypothetical protein